MISISEIHIQLFLKAIKAENILPLKIYQQIFSKQFSKDLENDKFKILWKIQFAKFKNNSGVIKDLPIKWPAWEFLLSYMFFFSIWNPISIGTEKAARNCTNNDINKAWFPIIYSLGEIFIE